MLKNQRAIRNIFYGLAALLGLCCAAWLILASKDVGPTAITRSQKHASHHEHRGSPSDHRLSIEQGFDRANNVLEQVDEDTNGISNTDSEQCSEQCGSALSMLDEELELDDQTFDRLEAYTEDIAAYLKGNDNRRQHYIEMALATADGDKRSFLTAVFKQLPYQQKMEIGASFISSESWRVRADGVTLIADDNAAGLDIANRLMDIFTSEENSYIKGRILATLRESSTLQGDTEILHQLDSAIYNEVDPLVRVAAFKAKVQLSEEPYHMLPDALQALRSSEPDLQFASIVAIERILEHERKHTENGVYIDKESIKNEFQMIRDLAVYDGDKERFDRLIREANAIYLRYFE